MVNHYRMRDIISFDILLFVYNGLHKLLLCGGIKAFAKVMLEMVFPNTTHIYEMVLLYTHQG